MKNSLCSNMAVQREIRRIFSHLEFVSRLLGLLINEGKGSKSGISKICRYAWWIFISSIQTVVLYSGLSIFYMDYFKHNWLMISVRQIKFLIDFIMIIFTVGTTPFVTKNLYSIMDTTVSVDEELGILSLPMNYEKTRRIAIIGLYGNIAFTIFYFVGYNLLTNHCDVHSFRFDVWEATIIIQIILEVQFLTLMMVIYCRFKALNTYLEEFHTGKLNSNDIFWVTPVGARSSHLCVISRAHDKLCSLSKEVGSIYSLNALLTITQCFISMTLMVYDCFTSFYVKKSFCIITGAALSIAFSVYEIFSYIYASKLVSSECYRTAGILHRLERALRYDSKNKTDVMLFSLQVLHCDVKFSACGLFQLDFTLLQSIINALTTYLIIIIQFDLSDRFTVGLNLN